MELLFRVSIILSNRAATAGDYAVGLKFLTKARALHPPGNPELDRRMAEIKSLDAK